MAINHADLEVIADIDKSKYIWILDTRFFIARDQSLNDLDWNATHERAGEQNLFMSPPSLFFPHYLNTRDAAQGKSTLYDAYGHPLSKSTAGKVWKDLSTDCWIWLDALFKRKKKLVLETDHRVGQQTKGKDVISFSTYRTSPLERCVKEDNVLVDLASFNNQGFPTRKSKEQDYSRGDNLYFYEPQEDCVAGFGADSVRASLNCDWDPQGSYASLGVLLCAEGAQRK